MASSSLQNESAQANAPLDQFAVAHLWAALGDIPEIYGLKAAKGALRALADAIERAEKGLPPLSIATPVERQDGLQRVLPTLEMG